MDMIKQQRKINVNGLNQYKMTYTLSQSFGTNSLLLLLLLSAVKFIENNVSLITIDYISNGEKI